MGRASCNTMWCLIGCSIGDIGTIAYFDYYDIDWPVLAIMALAIFNGLLTSIILETIILSRQMALDLAVKTALGMSLTACQFICKSVAGVRFTFGRSSQRN